MSPAIVREYTMRRNDRQITDRAEIDAIIRGSTVCRLGMSDSGRPYVIPLCFGYDGRVLYLHSATEGRKLDVLRRNPRVCVEFDIPGDVVQNEDACSWSIGYRSVVAFGTARFLDEPEEKRKALALVMAQYARPGQEFSFSNTSVDRTVVLTVAISEITGKQSGR